MRLAIIPARGGSKRIPRKNIRLFAGKPMIAYAIEAAHASALFDHIIVSTDDPEIAAVSAALRAQVPFVRPSNLSDDHTPTVPVIAHAIDACRAQGLLADHVCCIYPGVPLLRVEDIVSCLEMLAHGDADYVFPVAAFASPIQRALKRSPNGSTQPYFPQYADTRTQDLEPAYHDAGQFYWGKSAAWLSGLNIHTHGRTFVLPEWRVIDIDTPDDWTRAEALYRSLQEVPPR